MASSEEPLRQTLHDTVPKLSVLQNDLYTWVPQREKVITNLLSIAEEVDEIQRKADVATAVGTTTAAVGLGLCLIPGGVVFGLGMLAAGTVSGISANAINALLGGTYVERAKTMIERDAAGQKDISDKIEDIEGQVERLEKVYPAKEKNRVRTVVYTSNVVYSRGVDIDTYSRSVHNMLTTGKSYEDGKLFSSGMPIFENGNVLGNIIKTILSVIFLPFILFDIVGCLKRLLDDQRSTCGEEIRKTVGDMRRTKEELEKMRKIIETGNC